ncbi:MAG: hypothetical protein CEN90_590 [Parcubacteria group bacterium Licking1014_17]|nr:MAG: hypothetical protein CEN90_590 [Parcubacteria group bacterium Licking1014_17]
MEAVHTIISCCTCTLKCCALAGTAGVFLYIVVEAAVNAITKRNTETLSTVGRCGLAIIVGTAICAIFVATFYLVFSQLTYTRVIFVMS